MHNINLPTILPRQTIRDTHCTYLHVRALPEFVQHPKASLNQIACLQFTAELVAKSVLSIKCITETNATLARASFVVLRNWAQIVSAAKRRRAGFEMMFRMRALNRFRLK